MVVEVGYDELEATVEDPELKLSAEVIDVFAALGLDAPAAIRVLPLHHQVAQKLHACTEPGNERAHDLVDLQLIAPRVDVGLVASTTRRLFAFRRQHQWPAVVVGGQTWPSLYVEAAQGLPVLGDVDEAIVWANDYIAVLDRSVPDG